MTTLLCLVLNLRIVKIHNIIHFSAKQYTVTRFLIKNDKVNEHQDTEVQIMALGADKQEVTLINFRGINVE